MKQYSLGADIGGSHITCQLYDWETETLVKGSESRIPVDGSDTKESILNSWTEAIKKSLGELTTEDLMGIGFAMPGPFDYKNGIARFDKNVGKFHSLHGVDVKTELIKRLGLPIEFPVRFMNDAAAFAVGEANVEAVSAFERILVLTLGTGFGSTFIENGLPVAGKYGIPEDGFLYHIPFKSGIADEYFSTRWFIGEYKKATGKNINGVKQLVEDYKNDSEVRDLFSGFGKNLGLFLVPWIEKFNVECIILGGNISKSLSLFQSEIRKEFTSAGVDVQLRQSVLNEEAALIGSARLCDDTFYSKLIK